MQPWWQTGIIYQVYPRSFQDSNRDGVGDLRGITSRLDYVQSLHVDAVWLSPIFPSPFHDFGYDVSDYVNIHPLFGDLEDFDELVRAVHARGMKLLLDLVPNHTSDEHAWFVASRTSRTNPQRDWYIWRDPAPDGGPPNNWLSFFGGPAWTYDERTGQYYLHQFVKQQPELNYRNPAVVAAICDAMRFWLERGVDGFRVDVIWLMIKDEQLRDEPPDPAWDGVNPHASLRHIYTGNQPEVHACHPAHARRAGRVRRPDDGRRDLPAQRGTHPVLRRRSRRMSPAVQLPAHQRAVARAHRPAAWSTTTRPYSRPVRGPTGCWATTTSTASPPASARRRPGSPRCCC